MLGLLTNELVRAQNESYVLVRYMCQWRVILGYVLLGMRDLC
jgi:hypothetical protein